jgi:uncharacterized protein (TIGR02145 family)
MKEVIIGPNTWAAENLNTANFRNGESIDEITNQEEWFKFIESETPGWCYYNFDQENEKYGKIYNFYAVVDDRGLAPSGWKIPSNSDWDEFIESIGENNADLIKNTSGWWEDENGTNQSGFSALPGGYNYNGDFCFEGAIAMWWSMEEFTKFKTYVDFDNEPEPLFIYPEDTHGYKIHRGINEEKISITCNGYYIRCLKGKSIKYFRSSSTFL